MNAADVLVTLSGGGVIGGVIVAIVQGLFGRRGQRATATRSLAEAEAATASADKDKADAAEVLTRIAATMTAGMRVENEKVLTEIRELKTAVNGLAHAVEVALPLLDAAGYPEVASTLRDANQNVRKVI